MEAQPDNMKNSHAQKSGTTNDERRGLATKSDPKQATDQPLWARGVRSDILDRRPMARSERALHRLFSMKSRAALLVFLLAACSGRIPHPPYASHPPDALVEVDYPPPPARVESVPEQPVKNAVWLNGEWSWTGRRWGWKPGGWVVVPEGAKYAKLALVRRSDGKLFSAQGTWRNAEGKEIPAPEFLAGTPSRASSVVDPEGDPAPTSADLQSDGGVDAGQASSEEPRAPRPKEEERPKEQSSP